MNCLDVCRQLASDPGHLDEEIQRHLQECSQCAAYALEQQSFNKRLKLAALVDVPDGLEARILLRQTIEQQNKNLFSVRRFLAVAAVLLVTIGLTIVLFQPVQLLESAVLAHIKNEEYHLTEFKKVSHVKLNNMLGQLQLGIATKPEEMTYAGTCNIHRYNGAHFVVKGKRGRVTVLIMPGEFVSKITRVKGQRFRGLIYPTSYGSMAVVGEVEENIDKIYKEFQNLVKSKS